MQQTLKASLITLITLLCPLISRADVFFQIQQSNIFCVIDQISPRVEIHKNDGKIVQVSFPVAYAAVKKLKSTDQKTLTSLKKQLKTARGKKKTSLQKKITTVKARITDWNNIMTGIVVCSMQPPLVSGGVGGGGFTGVIPISSFSQLAGAIIAANDNQFLGIFSNNQFVTDSIANAFNSYGNKFSSYSIFNQFGNYGSAYSSKSPWNAYASEPPILILNGKAVAYLTVNSSLTPRVDPYDLLTWLGY